MNVIPFKINGTEEALIRVKAGAVYFRSAVLSNGATDETIIVTAQGNAETLILEPGQGCPVDTQITEWRVRSLNGVGTVEGKLVFGNAGFTDNRLQVSGAVEVIDGGKSRTLEGMAFMGFADKVAVAGKYSMGQFWNPAGSGKNCVIEQIIFSTTADAKLYVRQNLAAVAELLYPGYSKLIGGAGSSLQIRRDELAGFPASDPIMLIQTKADVSQTVKFSEPLVLPPGRGLLVLPHIQNIGVMANVEFYEELVAA